MLTCHLDLLTGVYRAGLPDRSAPEWPPHPERLFSALVQAWADGGKRPDERAALAWLEALPPPRIEAGDAHPRDRATYYVPPNDMRGDEVGALPERRTRKERLFDACVPSSPTVRLQWDANPSPVTQESLRALAGRMASLGHSASLVRCSFDAGDVVLDPSRVWEATPDGEAALRITHAGRLDDLERWFDEGTRPRSSVMIRYSAPLTDPERRAPAKATNFGAPRDWFVFEGQGGGAPDVLAFAHVAARVRDALMKLGPQPSPDILCGHASDGRPASSTHAAILPLANVGWEHATGDLLGFAVVLPRNAEPGARRAALRALAAFARAAPARDEAVAMLRMTRDWVWALQRVAAPTRASLVPHRYCATARTWASVTPVLLDRFPHGGDPTEEARILAAACTNIGLDEPESLEIHKHSAVRQGPSAYPARGVAHRVDWSFPRGSKLANRPRRHVVLRFAEPVSGPVVLGAGRYHGFGLCLPLDDAERT